MLVFYWAEDDEVTVVDLGDVTLEIARLWCDGFEAGAGQYGAGRCQALPHDDLEPWYADGELSQTRYDNARSLG